MADAASFEIEIAARSIGVTSTADEINALAERIKSADSVATQFDEAVAATAAKLAEASAASALASREFGKAESKYDALERAAVAASKALEKAKAAGKPTENFEAQYAQATEALKAQTAVVDQLKAKASAAAAEESKLAASLKVLEKQQSTAAGQIRKTNEEQAKAGKEAAKVSSAFEEVGSFKSAFAALPGPIGLATAAFVAMGVAGVAALYSIGKFALSTNLAAMNRLTLAQQRFELGAKRIFRDLKFDKFVRGLEDIGTLFDETNASAKGLKALAETIFQPLFDSTEKIAPLVKEMFKGLIYGGMQVVIAVLKIRNAIFSAMSPETRASIRALADKIFSLENAFKVGTVAAVAIAGVAVLLTAVMGSLAFTAGLVLLPIVAISAAVAGAIYAFNNWGKVSESLKDTWNGFVDWVTNLGRNIWQGLVNGIMAGKDTVVSSFKSLAESGVRSFKDFLGIKSPSAVMRLQAEYTTAGYVQGLERGAPEVQSALESMVSPSDARGLPAGGASSTTNTNARSVTVQSLVINAPSGNADDIAAAVRDALINLLEGAAVQIGGGEVPA